MPIPEYFHVYSLRALVKDVTSRKFWFFHAPFNPTANLVFYNKLRCVIYVLIWNNEREKKDVRPTDGNKKAGQKSCRKKYGLNCSRLSLSIDSA